MTWKVDIDITKMKICPVTINFVNTFKIKVKRRFNINAHRCAKCYFPRFRVLSSSHKKITILLNIIKLMIFLKCLKCFTIFL